MGDIDGGDARRTHSSQADIPASDPPPPCSCTHHSIFSVATQIRSVNWTPSERGGGEECHRDPKPPQKQRSSGTYCSLTLDCLWSRWQAAQWERGEYACKAMTRWRWSFCSGSWSSISKGKRKNEMKTGNPWGVSSSAALLRPNHYSSFAQRAAGATLSFLFSHSWLRGRGGSVNI